MEVQKQDNGYIIWENLFFWDEIKDNYLNLQRESWEDMIFGEEEKFKIEYPGEYDKDDIYFKVIEDSESKLNYFIRTSENKVAIIQSPEVIKEEDFDNIDFWIYTQESIAKKIEEMEFEWEKILLD